MRIDLIARSLVEYYRLLSSKNEVGFEKVRVQQVDNNTCIMTRTIHTWNTLWSLFHMMCRERSLCFLRCLCSSLWYWQADNKYFSNRFQQIYCYFRSLCVSLQFLLKCQSKCLISNCLNTNRTLINTRSQTITYDTDATRTKWITRHIYLLRLILLSTCNITSWKVKHFALVTG